MNAVINFGFYKMQGISWLAEELSLTRRTLCSMEVDHATQSIHFTWLIKTQPVIAVQDIKAVYCEYYAQHVTYNF